jgi:hypothetical protein
LIATYFIASPFGGFAFGDELRFLFGAKRIRQFCAPTLRAPHRVG